MSLKCSIFGHRFGEAVVERDRDESGSEVVITIQEIQTCDRCGEQRVVSENKEVTTLETPEEGDEEPRTEVPDAADELAAVQSGSSGGEEADSGTAADDADAGTAAPDAEAGTPADAPAGEEALDPETDDATIIEDSPEESIVEEAEPDEPTPAAPDVGSGTEEEEADPGEDDAVILDDEDEEADEPEREPGAWPEEPEDDGPEWEPPTDVGGESAETESALDEASVDVEPVGEAVTVPQGSFHCPECGFSTAVDASSLRAGDFCPDCHTGTLVHEPDAE